MAVATAPGAESADPARFRADLLSLVTFNVLIGNGDAHAKNDALFRDAGLLSLAPAYDVAPTFYVSDRFGGLGMRVDGRRRLAHLTAGHLVREAAARSVAAGTARDVIAWVIDSVGSALSRTPTDGLTGPVAERVAARCADVRRGL